MEKMKVYVVCGGFNYEGEDLEDSIGVFYNESDSVKYGESLIHGSYVREDGVKVLYDYYKVKEVVVG